MRLVKISSSEDMTKNVNETELRASQVDSRDEKNKVTGWNAFFSGGGGLIMRKLKMRDRKEKQMYGMSQPRLKWALGFSHLLRVRGAARSPNLPIRGNNVGKHHKEDQLACIFSNKSNETENGSWEKELLGCTALVWEFKQ